MTIRTLAFLLLTSLLPVLGHGQEDRLKVKVRMSNDADAQDRLFPARIIRTTDNSLVVFKAKVAGAIIAFVPLIDLEYRFELYTMDKMELVRSIEPNLSAPGGQVAIEDIVYFGDRPIFISSQRRSTEKRFKILWQEFDPRLTRNNAPALELASIDYGKFSGGMPIMGQETMPFGFQVKLSPDSTKMLVYSPEMRTEDNRSLHFVMVVNEKMEPIWQEFITSEVKSNRSQLLDAVVDNKGTATVWVKNNFSGKDVKDGAVNFESRVYRLGLEGRSESVFNLESGAYPTDVAMIALANGNVACGGVFGSLDEKKDKTPGTFSAVLVAGEQEFSLRSTTAFPMTGKNEDKIYENMGVADLLRGSDGLYHMVCEVSYSYEASVSSTTGRNSTVTKYVHGDVAVQSYKQDGTLDWMTIVPRYINTASFLLGNTLSVLYENQLCLMFLDDEENIERRKRGEKLEKGIDAKDARTMLLNFERGGKYRTKVVLASGKDVDYMAGMSVFQATKDTYYTMGQRKLGSGKFVPVKVEFSTESR